MNAVLHTSGTTRKGKPYALTTEQNRYRQERKGKYRGAGWRDLKSIYLGIARQSGVSQRNATWAMERGVEIMHPYKTRAETMEMLSSFKIDGALTSPADLLGLAYVAGDFRFKHMIATGAMLLPEHSAEIRGRLGDDLWVSYGCSETGCIAYGPAIDTAEVEPGCVGKVCDDIETTIFGEQLLVRGPSVIGRYDDGTPALVGGWFATGDRARFRSDGMLVLMGRLE